MRCLSRIDFVV